MRPRILVVEDEPALQQILAFNLTAAGFEVEQAFDGEEALDRLLARPPDLVLLDWMLPERSGLELCRRIRRDPALRDLPVVMLTARGEEADRVRGLEGGADDYVTKPFSMAELIARLRAVLAAMRERLGVPLILVSHDPDDASIADWRWHMRNGRLIHESADGAALGKTTCGETAWKQG